MKVFVPLRPEGLTSAFDAELHGEEPIVDLAESGGKIDISYTFPGFFRSDDSREVDGEEMPFMQLDISSAGFYVESGKPLLPAFSRYVQIPPGCEYRVSSRTGAPRTFDNVLLSPAQELATDSPEAEEVFEFDREFYATDELYPEQVVQVKGPFTIDDYTALLVTVVPMQCNPGRKTLTGFGTVEVSIAVTPGAERDEPPVCDPDLDSEAFGNLFLNPGRGIEERLDMATDRPMPYLRCWGPDLLIVHPERFASPARRLARWKTVRGLRVQRLAVEAIGPTTTHLKRFIRSRRGLGSRLRYVLLLGDVDHIPTELIPGGVFGSNVSDYYYATPRDPVHADDLVMPWLSLGRIPIRSLAEAQAVVSQIIAYEKRPPTAAGYYERMAFAAYFQGDGRANRAYVKTMEAIREHMLTLGFDVERIYVSQTGDVDTYRDGSAVPADVQAAMMPAAEATTRLVAAANEGRLISGHRDHGGPDGWSHPPFGRTDLDSVTSGIPSLFYSVNCLTGQFDLAAPTESFAEKILRMRGAAPSVIAATRVSQTWLNDALIKGLFDGTWGGLLPTFPGGTVSYPVRRNRLGDLLNYAKAFLPVSAAGSMATIRDHFEIYHVIGDPSLEVWRARPRRASLAAWVAGRSLRLRLGRVYRDATLTIWHGNRLIRRLRPTSTHLSVALPAAVFLPSRPARRLSVCLWAPGYRFRRVTPQPLRVPAPGTGGPAPRRTEPADRQEETEELVTA